MKLKEYPYALYRSRQLLRLKAETLRSRPPEPVPVIVSLTSIPSRLNVVHITVRSLMSQTCLPEKIVLWLHHDLKNNVPPELSCLTGDLFEIRYVDLTCSHRKLVHSLEAFPGKVVVTADDDLMYESNWLAHLYESHRRSPHDIIGNTCRKISRDEHGVLLPYREWSHERRRGVTAEYLLAIGSDGVLYPPECLSSEATDSSLFLSLAPRADDLWFKAMSLRKGTQVRTSYHKEDKPVWPIIASQKIALKKQNVREDANRTQWLALSEHFGFEHVGVLRGV